ncbi:putative MFS monocarboxylate transporter [Coniochaeta ligniaria NRRL 30616]|uniref:Putative MFS monocarboxylate transporter n=1 Tax=Coniochaeta ligniaria NRRL 30616 TaxID=1408157 RepID=A0A1J7J8K8_9PEZI|nr:putative MFS monocarboxylate transporter [Coniochaeta ligniaria NRRL 30616]
MRSTGAGQKAKNVRAGLAVMGASLAFFCTVGFLNAFGVFQQYYKANMLRTQSDSDISWIGSVTIFFLYALAPLSGGLVDRIGPTWLLVGGSLGQLVAVFLASLCTKYFQLFLAQAVLLGLSMAFITWPPIGVVSRALPNHRGLALGIVIGGSSLGGVIWPIMLERLLDHSSLGFGWVMRIVAFTMLPLLGIACVTILEAPRSLSPSDPSEPSESSDTAVEEGVTSSNDNADATIPEKPQQSEIWMLLKNKVFIFLAAGLAIAYIGVFIPFFYISSYATEKGVSQEVSFYLISALNGASLLGRVLAGHLADRWGHYNMMIMAMLASTVISFSWTAASSLAGVAVIAVVYGFTSGAILSLQGACATKIASRQMQGTSMGMLMGTLAVTTVIGTPVGGAILTRYGYLSLSMFTGASLLIGSILVVVARVILDERLLSSV